MSDPILAPTRIPWFSPELGAREENLVIETIRSNYINDGSLTRLFEKKVAAVIGVQHCVAVTSGTAAIALSLMGMGIGPGDQVIVPDLTFIATANAVRLVGAEVILVDIEPERFTLDIPKTVAAITSRTRAIVPVDVNGRGADYAELERISRDRGIRLITDSAEGFGSKWKGRALGSFGDAGCFSFSANKTITTGQGGMIATNDTVLYHRLLELKDQGRRSQGTGGNDLHPVMGYNFKLTNLQAAVGIAQLERLQERLVGARQRDLWYRDTLGELPGILIPPVDYEGGETLQWADVLVKDRDQAASALTCAGIGCRPFWHPLHAQKPYALDGTLFPGAHSVSERGLWLPSSFSLTREQAIRAAEALIRGAAKTK
jgi:perosamine synthetase